MKSATTPSQSGEVRPRARTAVLACDLGRVGWKVGVRAVLLEFGDRFSSWSWSEDQKHRIQVNQHESTTCFGSRHGPDCSMSRIRSGKRLSQWLKFSRLEEVQEQKGNFLKSTIFSLAVLWPTDSQLPRSIARAESYCIVPYPILHGKCSWTFDAKQYVIAFAQILEGFFWGWTFCGPQKGLLGVIS